ncbi:MAG: N-acetyltransferase [Lachnospiraceae bacterium]|nr:N-acetyltransferase [Lachnospiraceae bacterium]
MLIRQEKPEDYGIVYSIVKEAFKNAEHTDGNEQNLVTELRKSKSFIPELSLVAVDDKKIVGHILFTKALVNDVEVLALAPLSVLPDYQNRGIGLSLIKEGHKVAARLGYKYAVVLGHSKYYPKADYIPASQYEIKAPFEVNDENFMAVSFSGTKDKLNGIMEYDKAFGV